MDILSAKSVFSGLPADLDALIVVKRAVIGKTMRMIAVGDTSFSGRIERLAREIGWENVLREFHPFFQQGDLVFGNFENSLQSLKTNNNRGLFTPLPESIKTLKQAGFHVMNLAHNHILDNGVEGLITTIDAIHQAEIIPLGIGKSKSEAQSLVRTDIEDIRVGWLACGRTQLVQPTNGPKFWEFNEDELLSMIKRVKSEVDILFVSVHIGLMFIDFPRPETQAFAQKAVEAGANVLLMHHAHTLQGVQVVAPNGIVCYNLGNFLFDWQEGDIQAPIVVDQQNEGGVFVFDFDSKGIAQVAILPTVIDENYCSVHWAVGIRGRVILQRLVRISAAILGNYKLAFERQRAERNASHILREMLFELRRANFRSLFGLIKRFRFEHIKMIVLWFTHRGP